MKRFINPLMHFVGAAAESLHHESFEDPDRTLSPLKKAVRRLSTLIEQHKTL